jgi:hypothetical protein
MVGPLCRHRNAGHKAKGGIESLEGELFFDGEAIIAQRPTRPVGKRGAYG